MSKIRLRSFKTKKEKKTTPTDDDVPWFQAAMLGLQIGSTLLGASGTAKASRAKGRAAKEAMLDIDASLNSLGVAAGAKEEGLREDATMAMKQSGDKTSTMYNELQQKKDSMTGGFAMHGGVEETYTQMEDKLETQFKTGSDNLLRNLDKQTASIEEWRIGETERLTQEKRKLKAGQQAASQTSTTWKALGF